MHQQPRSFNTSFTEVVCETDGSFRAAARPEQRIGFAAKQLHAEILK
jgi:hypothetical protein